ncbi:hypothetical protein NIES2100_61960 [Calothrix sp. NIES-2100]|uniref:hypothetical protein n=1 Tax=Calothrix sp. NIES-2100 TaxID=1954172 RepID=UPI000B5DEF6C|nr:hypothetical protein NIES2100_61960 [Calothrix sp. NIES-2100]
MNNYITCIECGHYPVSIISLCPKCSKNPYGHICRFCNAKVTDSEAILSKENIRSQCMRYDFYGELHNDGYIEEVKVYHYHQRCFNDINTIEYICHSCSSLHTKFSNSCLNCGQIFSYEICDFCRLLVIKELAVKVEIDLLDEIKYFHPICTGKIRRKLEALADYKARLDEERKQKEVEESIKKQRREQRKLRNLIWILYGFFL